MANIQVAVINESTVLTDQQVQTAMSAFQTQVHRDFAPAWGIDADLSFVASGAQAPTTSWWLVILDNSDQAGALGYHDLTTQGLPLGKIFAGTDIQNGYQWSVTASHELLEMLADPYIDLTAFVQKTAHTGTLYAYEVCDACEADKLGYSINGVAVSDFVYPAWFEYMRPPTSAQFDYSKQIQQPLQLLPGGYIGTFDVKSGSGWHQVTAEGTVHTYSLRAPLGSRRERRRTPRDQWMLSTVKVKART